MTPRLLARVLPLVLLCQFHSGSFAGNTNGYFPLWQPQPPNITDLAFLYQGGGARPPSPTNRFAPYVSYRDAQTGREQWLFDGFLLFESQTSNRVFQAVRVNKTHPPAQKTTWAELLGKNFEADDGIASLEKACRDTSTRIGLPLRRRQVILTLPEPVAAQTNWGSLNGRALNFRKATDRLAAINWYIETALQKWKDLAPQQLELAGFYWGPESFPDFWKPEPLRGTNFLPTVAAVVHAHKQKFFWIPCWHKNWAQSQWRSLGFDIAWQQPNHFFHPEIPDTRLDEACVFAGQHGMGLEFECNGRMIDEPDKFERRFDAYLDAFAQHDVKQTAAIAYFDGAGALIRLANSPEARMRAHYDRLARFIRERQTLADKLFQRQ